MLENVLGVFGLGHGGFWDEALQERSEVRRKGYGGSILGAVNGHAEDARSAPMTACGAERRMEKSDGLSQATLLQGVS
jgi:hypothetical protein